MVVEQGQLPGGSGRQLLPELFDAMVADAASAGMKDDSGQLPVPKAVVEAFEALEFLDDFVGYPPSSAHRDDLERLREQTQHALRLKAALEGADRFGVGVGFLGPLAGGTLLQEYQWADECIALLHHVVEGQLGVVNVCTSHHSGGLPAAAPAENVLGPPGQAAHHASPCREGHVSPRGAGQAVRKTIGVARGPILARLETGRESYRPGGLGSSRLHRGEHRLLRHATALGERVGHGPESCRRGVGGGRQAHGH